MDLRAVNFCLIADFTQLKRNAIQGSKNYYKIAGFCNVKIEIKVNHVRSFSTLNVVYQPTKFNRKKTLLKKKSKNLQ